MVFEVHCLLTFRPVWAQELPDIKLVNQEASRGLRL
jgi:hypothetical protein